MSVSVVGTKNVAKQMSKITQGRVKDVDRNKTWHPELVDKRTIPSIMTLAA